MVRLVAAAALLLAGSIGLVAAQTYADFPLDPTTETTFAGTLDVLGTFGGDVETNRAACNVRDSCIAFICQSTANNCILLSVGDTTNSANPGFDSVHWKYDAAEGPSCNSATNTIPASDGFCVCDFDTEEQNTAFGCLARLVLPSQAALRQRIARNRIMPGMVKKAFFEEKRSGYSTGKTLESTDM